MKIYLNYNLKGSGASELDISKKSLNIKCSVSSYLVTIIVNYLFCSFAVFLSINAINETNITNRNTPKDINAAV